MSIDRFCAMVVIALVLLVAAMSVANHPEMFEPVKVQAHEDLSPASCVTGSLIWVDADPLVIKFQGFILLIGKVPTGEEGSR